MRPDEQAAAILNHYMGIFARHNGMRWDDRNRADIERAIELLASVAGQDDAGDTIPPYQDPGERVTRVFDRDEINDPEFIAWRAERRAVTRMVNRNSRYEVNQ